MTAIVPVTFGSLVIDGETEDANGTLWEWTKLDGWWGHASSRVVESERQPEGVTMPVARRGGRPILVGLLAKNPRWGRPLDTLVFPATRTLKRAAPALDMPVLLRVEDPDLSLETYVREAQPLRAKIENRLAAISFEYPVVAPDGRAYAADPTVATLTLSGSATATSATVTNDGDAPTAPVITIEGPATNPKVWNATIDGDPYQQYVGTLGALDTLVIDLATGDAEVNGSDVTEDMHTGGRPWQVLPGNNTIHYTRTAGASTSTAELVYRDAYR